MSSNKDVSGSKKFYREHGTELQDFLYRAQMNGYGNPDANPIAKEDGSFSMSYTEGDWHYTDHWCGGEPFAGMSTVWYKGAICWSMVYWGRIMPIPYLDYSSVTRCLSEALQKMEAYRPWRGPNSFQGSGPKLLYCNKWIGGIRRFSGEEIIYRGKGKEIVYKANYIGGIVNKDLAVGMPISDSTIAANEDGV